MGIRVMSWNPQHYPRGRGQVSLSVSDRLAVVTFDNPGAKNAMSVGMMADVVRIINELEQADVSVVLLRGAPGGGFCSGGDLKDVRRYLMNPEAAAGMPIVMGDALDRLASLPSVIVAAVEGAALGGGAEILMHLDRVTMSTNAVLGFVHSSLGVSPGWGGGCRLIERVGQRLAMQILVEGRRLPAQAALELGLVDRVVSASAITEVRAYLTTLTRREAHVIRGAVSLCRTGRGDRASSDSCI